MKRKYFDLLLSRSECEKLICLYEFIIVYFSTSLSKRPRKCAEDELKTVAKNKRKRDKNDGNILAQLNELTVDDEKDVIAVEETNQRIETRLCVDAVKNVCFVKIVRSSEGVWIPDNTSKLAHISNVDLSLF